MIGCLASPDLHMTPDLNTPEYGEIIGRLHIIFSPSEHCRPTTWGRDGPRHEAFVGSYAYRSLEDPRLLLYDPKALGS